MYLYKFKGEAWVLAKNRIEATMAIEDLLELAAQSDSVLLSFEIKPCERTTEDGLHAS
jgi:hypothetical protein